ncbi:MAG: PAS domain S-box protein [Desulfobacteraceae bacterium]
MKAKPTYEELKRRVQELEKHRRLFETMAQGVIYHASDGVIISANPAAERILGLSFEQMRNKTSLDPGWRMIKEDGTEVPGTDHPAMIALGTGETFGPVVRGVFHRDKNAYVWLSITAIPLFQPEEKKPFQSYATFEDVTEHKLAKEALRRERERLASIIEGTNVGTWEWNVQTGETIFNERWAEIIGYSLEEISPVSINTWMKFVHPDDVKTSEKLLQRHFSGELNYYECEARIRHKNGEWVWVLDRGKVAAWTEDGKPLHMMGTHQDITKPKKDVIALQESKQLLQNLLEAIPDMVSVHDKEMTILYSNWNGFGAVPEEKRIIGTKCYRTYRGYDEICPDCQAKTVLQTKKSFQTETRLPDGRWVDLRVIPIYKLQRNNVFFLEWVRDITENKQADAERENLQSQLIQAQKMESVGRLAGGVAHDFNNMLGVILGHAELVLLKADENHDLHSNLKEIQTAAQRSADITKQLLAFARKQTISPKQLDLNAIVESMLNMLRRLIGEDIDLVWQPSTHLWPVKMDPSQIDQILANLCVNARDAIDGVGKLTIETGKKSFDEEYCRQHFGFISGDFVLLAVSDNGCGMDREILENLFEPFFTTKEVGKGTGLGLPTVYGIVKQNNGFINVYSESGQGSTFKIYLPRLVGDENSVRQVSGKKEAAGGTETILLVEDEPSILRMTRMMLEKKGYTVLSAATPAEALEKAKSHSGTIDLLMTDVVMPEMNGRDLSGKINDLYPDIRLLFMSGYTSNVIAHQGILDDGVAFIQKPFSMADMTVKVRKILDNRTLSSL